MPYNYILYTIFMFYRCIIPGTMEQNRLKRRQRPFRLCATSVGKTLFSQVVVAKISQISTATYSWHLCKRAKHVCFPYQGSEFYIKDKIIGTSQQNQFLLTLTPPIQTLFCDPAFSIHSMIFLLISFLLRFLRPFLALLCL